MSRHEAKICDNRRRNVSSSLARMTAKRREQKRAQSRRYYERNKLRLVAVRRAWVLANRDKVRVYSRARYASKKDLLTEQRRKRDSKRAVEIARLARKRRRKNAAAIKAQKRRYLATPAGRAAAKNGFSRRRARIRACASTVTTAQIRQLLKAARKCAYCGLRFTSKRKPTLDHVVPLARGGAHSLGNLAVCCKPCNSTKGAKLL